MQGCAVDRLKSRIEASMAPLLYLSLFAAASAGTLADALLDRKLGIAALTSIAHVSGFFAVLQWAMPGISYEVLGLTVLCGMSCVWDVWSSLSCAFSMWNRDASGDSEVIGVAIMLGARIPAYAFPALVALDWIS